MDADQTTTSEALKVGLEGPLYGNPPPPQNRMIVFDTFDPPVAHQTAIGDTIAAIPPKGAIPSRGQLELRYDTPSLFPYPVAL